jgi:hypothetical protein
MVDTQYQLISHGEAYTSRDSDQGFGAWHWGARTDQWGQWGWQQNWPNWGWQQAPQQPQRSQNRPAARNSATPRGDPSDPRSRARRDQDYFWGGRFN